MIVCDLCGRPEGEHSRDGLDTPNEHHWFWLPNACPDIRGSAPFHPTQTFYIAEPAPAVTSEEEWK
jgi:hypothetical protein